MDVLLHAGTGWRLGLGGSDAGVPTSPFSWLVLDSGTNGSDRLRLALQNPLEIPDAAIEPGATAGAPARLSLRNLEEAERERLIRILSSLVGSSATTNGAVASFFGAMTLAGRPLASAQGSTGVRVETQIDRRVFTGEDFGVEIAVRFTAKAALTLSWSFVGGQTGQVAVRAALTVALDAQGTLADLGLEGLPLNLKRVRLPDWSLTWPESVISIGSNIAAPAWLKRLGIDAIVTTTGAPFRVRAELAGSDLSITVRPSDGVDPATLRLTLRPPAAAGGLAVPVTWIASFSELRFVGGQVTGLTVTPPTVAFTLAGNPEGKVLARALRIRWDQVTVEPGWTSDRGLGFGVKFTRVVLEAADDPATRIGLGGVLQLTAGSLKVERLDVLEAGLSNLPVQVVEATAEAAGMIVSAAAETAGRLAAVLANVVGLALRAATAGADGLVALARRVTALAEALRQKVAALADAVPVDIQLQVTLDPPRIRRVLLLHGPLGDAVVAGLCVRPGAVRVGWLADLPSDEQDWALHSVALFEGTGDVTVGTDLWLDDRPLPDISAQNGEREAADPALTLTVARSTTAPDPVLLTLAGLEWRASGDASRVDATFLRQVDVDRQGCLTHPVDAGLKDPAGAVSVGVGFQPERLLPFLNGPDPGPVQGGKQFLEQLRQSVTVGTIGKAGLKDNTLSVPLELNIRAIGLEFSTRVTLELGLRTLRAAIKGDGGEIAVRIPPDALVKDAFGLRWEMLPAPPEDAAGAGGADGTGAGANDGEHIFDLVLKDGNAVLQLADGARIRLTYAAASPAGRGFAFVVAGKDGFRLSRGGLDLTAELETQGKPPQLNGLDLPLHPTQGRIVIRGGALVEASVSAEGYLPPALVGDVKADVGLRWRDDGSTGLVLDQAHAKLRFPGSPTDCPGTRFRATLREVSMGFVRDGGEHFYFLISGTLEFYPRGLEFADGLLKHLRTVRIELEQTPLAADASVLARHISFQVDLARPVVVPVFDAFRMELRGIGLHPHRDWADGPALRLSGQITFLDVGDVKNPGIDFHGLEIAPPSKGTLLPRVRCEGLGIDLRFGQGTRIRGAVMAVDKDNQNLVFDRSLLVPGYASRGFLGSGLISIDGFTTVAVTLGFLEIDPPEPDRPKQRAFFIYAERQKVCYPVATPVVPLYLREIGAGLGYRFTLAGIKAIEIARIIAEIVRRLDDLSRRKGELTKFSSWVSDPEPPGEPARMSVALRGAFSLSTASQGEVYNAVAESKLDNPLLFDVVAVLRSDLTFLMTARGWLSVNYADFVEAGDNVRNRPGFSGYLFVRTSRSELLARVVGWPDGHIGEHPKLHPAVIRALRSTRYSATLYIRPGLFHFELGWPDGLSWEFREGPLSLECAGGLLMRAHEQTLVYALNFRARAELSFGGSLDAGCVGVSASGVLRVAVQSRLFAAVSLQRASDSMLYGLVAIDAALRLSASAWLKIDLRFRKITLRASFGFDVQISVAAEVVAGPTAIGARAVARVGLPVFGRTLHVSVGLAVNAGAVDDARVRVQRYMALGIAGAGAGDATDTPSAEAVNAKADRNAQREGSLPPPLPDAVLPPPPATSGAPAPPPPPANAGQEALNELPAEFAYDADLRGTAFQFVIRKIADGSGYLALLVPVADDPGHTRPSGFFAAPPLRAGTVIGEPLNPQADDYVLHIAGVMSIGLERWDTAADGWSGVSQTELKLRTAWDASLDGMRVWELMRPAWAWIGSQPAGHLTAAHPPARVVEDETTGAPPDIEAALQGQLGQAARSALHERERAAAVHDARDFLFTCLMAGLDELSQNPDHGQPSASARLVRASGLLFRLTGEALTRLEGLLRSGSSILLKRRFAAANGSDKYHPATAARLFNPSTEFYETAPPTLTGQGYGRADGAIGLRWTLTQNGSAARQSFLSQYIVRREVEGLRGLTPSTLRIRPCPSLHADLDGPTRLAALRWQVTDRLEDAPPLLRQALLPAGLDSDGLAALTAWAVLFGAKDAVSVTYRVTPVDTAGTSGPERTVVAWVGRPLVRPRAARAELRFEFGALPGAPEGARPALDAYLHLADPFWDGSRTADIGTGGWSVEREYDLLVDFEETSPLGSYGGDGDAEAPLHGAGLLRGMAVDDAFVIPHARWRDVRDSPRAADWDRLRLQPGSADPDDTRDFVPLALSRLGPLGSPRQLLPPDEQARFLDRLWTACNGLEPDGSPNAWPPIRRAARFHLRTRVVLRHRDRSRPPIVHEAEPVPVDFEMHLAPGESAVAAKGGGANAGRLPYVLRPIWFEWPVAVELPPLAFTDLHCSTGFLSRVQPPVAEWVNPELEDLRAAGPGQTRFVTVRDPARRVVTELRWNAFPSALWTGSRPQGRGDAKLAEARRASLVAGWSVHELDLDDLPVDDIEQGRIAPQAWRRAALRARVQMQERQAARGRPADTNDASDWLAVYPSEAWRTGRGSDVATAQPRRRAWWSREDAIPVFPRRMPRRRLLPRIDDAWVDALLAAGGRFPLTVTLVAEDDRSAPDLVKGAFTFRLAFDPDLDPLTGGVHALAFSPQSGSRGELALTPEGQQHANGGRLADLLRRALSGLALRVNGAAPDEQRVPEGIQLPAMRLKVEFRDPTPGRSPAPPIDVDLNGGALHPVLEETLALVQRRHGVDPGQGAFSTTRPLSVEIIPPRGRGEADRTALLAATSVADDPYGWTVLRRLGLAACVRVHDAVTGAPLSLHDVRDTLKCCLADVLTRYAIDWLPAGYQEAAGSMFGQPTLEVLLQPFALDRMDSFDTPVSAGNGARLELERDALACWQLSLRPAVVPAWRILEAEFDVPTKWVTDALTAEARIGLHVGADQLDYAIQFVDAATAAGSPTVAGGSGSATRLKFTAVPGKDLGTRRVRVFVSLLATGQLPPPVLDLGDAKEDKVRGQWRPTDLRPDEGGLHRRLFKGPLQPDSPLNPGWVQAVRTLLEDPLDRAVARHAPVGGAAPIPAASAQADSEGAARLVAWAERFIEHAALPAQDLKPTYALCSPKRLNPWKLAPDSEGRLRLLLAHEDRWARVRAYAVKPASRYEDLARAAGYGHLFLNTLADVAMPALEMQAVPHADAVTPRTERLLPPALLGTRSRTSERGSNDHEAPGPVWELVVATHAEQHKADSNRMLAARLDFRGVGLAFFRTYRYPAWLARLDDGDIDPYPQKEPPVHGLPDEYQEDIGETAVVDAAADRYGSLHRGAQIVELRDLPYPYRHTVLAMAQAGVVVSPVARLDHHDAAARFGDQPGVPVMQVVTAAGTDGGRLLEVTLPLVRHRDLVDARTLDRWLDNGHPVADVPDPEVTYTVSLRRSAGQDSVVEPQVVEPQVEVTGVWRAAAEAGAPYVARVQGDVFLLAEQPGLVSPFQQPVPVPVLPVTTNRDGASGVTRVTLPLLPSRPARTRPRLEADTGLVSYATGLTAADPWLRTATWTVLSGTFPAGSTASAWSDLKEWLAAVTLARDDGSPHLPDPPPAAGQERAIHVEAWVPDKPPMLSSPDWLTVAQTQARTVIAWSPPTEDDWGAVLAAYRAGGISTSTAKRLQWLARMALTGGTYDTLRVRPARGAEPPVRWAQWDLPLYPLDAAEGSA